MNQTLEQLIQLQEIDHRLLEIREFMGDLPYEVESQQQQINSLQSENKMNQENIVELEKNIQHHKKEINNFNIKMEKYKDQLYLVKSNKEYDALNHEIDHMKTIISESEKILLKCKEEKTILLETIKLNTSKIESTSELLSGNQIALKEAMAETTHEQGKLEKNRKVLFKKIESNYLNVYERIRNSKYGIGMISINGDSCGGCYSQLPPQTIIEIKENNKIITCPNCSILLFWDGAEK